MSAYSDVFTEEYIAQIVTVFTILYYLFQCYFGYRFIKYLISIAGFIVGFIIGFSVAVNSYYFTNGYGPALIGIAVGLLLAFVVFKLYFLGIFIMCGFIAASAAAKLPVEGVLKLAICALAFLVAGILAVKFAKFCIIAITAISGAINAATLLKGPFPVMEGNTLVTVVVIALLAISGILIQRVTSKKRKR